MPISVRKGFDIAPKMGFQAKIITTPQTMCELQVRFPPQIRINLKAKVKVKHLATHI